MLTSQRRVLIATVAILSLSTGMRAVAQSEETAEQRNERILKEMVRAAQAIEDERQAAIRAAGESPIAASGLYSVPVNPGQLPGVATPPPAYNPSISTPSNGPLPGQSAAHGMQASTTQVMRIEDVRSEIEQSLTAALTKAFEKMTPPRKSAAQRLLQTAGTQTAACTSAGTSATQHVHGRCICRTTVVLLDPCWPCAPSYSIVDSGSIVYGGALTAPRAHCGLLSCLCGTFKH
jgi:hypothetical protein